MRPAQRNVPRQFATHIPPLPSHPKERPISHGARLSCRTSLHWPRCGAACCTVVSPRRVTPHLARPHQPLKAQHFVLFFCIVPNSCIVHIVRPVGVEAMQSHVQVLWELARQTAKRQNRTKTPTSLSMVMCMESYSVPRVPTSTTASYVVRISRRVCGAWRSELSTEQRSERLKGPHPPLLPSHAWQRSLPSPE